MSGTAAIYQKAGIVYEDHHMKDKEGNYQASPPRELKTLYDYLPSEKDSASEKKIPERLCLQGEINALKAQTHACGVYTLLHEEQRPWKGKKEDAGDVKNALWKHATEDLVIGLSKSSSSENVWIVAQWSTFATKPQVCMKITAALPYATPHRAHTPCIRYAYTMHLCIHCAAPPLYISTVRETALLTTCAFFLCVGVQV